MTGTAMPIHGGSHRNLQPAAPSPLATGCVLLLSVLVAALTVAAYWPVLQCGFVNYDDPLYVTANPHVQAGLTWPNVGWAFTAHHASNWHPVTWLSHMVDCQSFGLNPAGHHLVSLLLHLANTLLLFGLLNRLTRSCWPSALAALWFGVHPTHVESVAWVAERKDVLSTLFFLLTLWAYARYAEESNVSESASTANHASRATHYQPLAGPSSRRHLPATIYYLLSLGLFALGLMTKPMLVTLPFVLLLFDYWPLRRIAFPALQHSGTAALHSPHHSATPILFLIREKLPFFLLALLSCGTTLWAQASAGSVISMEAFPLAHRVANALLSCVRYVEQTFWPAHLAVFYPYEGPAPAWLVLGAGVALLAVTAATIRARRCPWLAVGWLWFVGTLVPVIGLVQVGTQAMADRYLYIPSIGLFIVAAFGLSELAARFRFGTMALAMLAGLTLAGCLLATRRQVLYWGDSETLLRHALTVTRGNYVAYNNLGTVLEDQGLLEQALSCYVESLRLKPDQVEAQINLGRVLMSQGRLDEAERRFRQVLQNNPKSYSAYYNLGNLLFRRGQTQAAITACRQALALNEDFPAAHNNLGCLLAAQGKHAEAIAHFQQSLHLRPDDPETLNNLGSVLTDQGRTAEALPPLTKAIQLKPGYAEAHYNLANAYAALKKPPEALAQYQTALRLNPGHDLAHYKLGNLLLGEGKADAAAEQYRAALAANTNLAEAHYQLATLRLPRKEAEEAIRQLQEALSLKPDWLEPLNNLAWLLATHPEAKYRNGPEAVRLAAHAVELTRNSDAEALDTLAAAYAEAGRFGEAVVTGEKAAELARKGSQEKAAASVADRSNLYRSGRPYRE